MKSFVKVLCMMSLVGFMYSCAGTEGTTGNTKDFSSYTDLAGALRSVGGLQVSGTGDNIIVTLRGMSTFNLNTQPLYVVNNVPVGNTYSNANSMVNPAEITSIRVLRGSSATTIYGEDGNHGVILIKTKAIN
mmetsp:Transcript_12943/g.17996  ORF Transcript_12943/g.17996 Transcript_12943/m.17996 type:complete len:132 (+) Transcript_12943:32-427(+)